MTGRLRTGRPGADEWSHLGGVQLDAAHHHVVGQGPAEYFMSKRDAPSVVTVAAILRATVSGEPT